MTRLHSFVASLCATLALSLPCSAQGAAAAQAATKPHPAIKLSSEDIKRAVMAAARKGTPAAPCACLKEYVDWCKQTTGKKVYYIYYTFTHISNSSVVGFSEGALNFDAGNGNLESGSTVGWPYWFSEARDGSGQPFNRPAAQKVIINVHPGVCNAAFQIGTNPTVTTPTLVCNNQIYTAADPSRGVLYVFTFKKLWYDVIF